jgi:hypothetical protein
MDTYGDMGNIITIQKRCSWRGIKTEISKLSIGQNLKPNVYDLFFFGGGQDNVQTIVAKDLKSKTGILKEYIENGSVLLSICGGYQLLQKYFKTNAGEIIEGIKLFDAYTEASNDRMIGNLLIETENSLQAQIENAYPKDNLPSPYLVGFENHSGKTYLGKNTKPLGTVITGSGNNGQDSTEGAIYKNAFGCYLHGSLLPKNPHFADLLIYKALQKKGLDFTLEPLDDSIEWLAHNKAVEKTRSSS